MQYVYGVVYVPLLEVAENFTGLTYKPTDVSSEGTVVLRSTNIQNDRLVFEDTVRVKMNNIPERAKVRANDILICVRNGSKALIGKAAMIPSGDEEMAFGAFMSILRAKPIIDSKYLYYVWQSSKTKDMIKSESGMPINQITRKEFDRVIVPLPPINEQRRIVGLLDSFEKLSNDYKDGIPAEIEARQKQYEYYRNKLLSFE